MADVAVVGAQPGGRAVQALTTRRLTEAEHAEVARKRELVHIHAPELVPFISALTKAGMIAGWRNVEKVTIHKEPDHGND